MIRLRPCQNSDGRSCHLTCCGRRDSTANRKTQIQDLQRREQSTCLGDDSAMLRVLKGSNCLARFIVPGHQRLGDKDLLHSQNKAQDTTPGNTTQLLIVAYSIKKPEAMHIGSACLRYVSLYAKSLSNCLVRVTLNRERLKELCHCPLPTTVHC